MLEASEVLFMGIGSSAVLWYRIALPAIHLGADWVGVQGHPPALQVVTGIVKGDTQLPNYDDYRLVIIQQPFGRGWFEQIKALQSRGIKVLVEVDDYLHGVASQPYHDYAKYFTKERLIAHERCMRVADGIITSTPYIARRYHKFNKNIYICPNGLDLARYQLTRPPRETTNIIWAGGTGHTQTLLPWVSELLKVMTDHPDTCFVAIGDTGFAHPVNKLFGAERAIGVPFCAIECYPAAMCLGDIALAPAGRTSWYRGKSDLRWLEASALGIATIADPDIYPEIEQGVTGMHATTPAEMGEALRELIEDPTLRWEMGQRACNHVNEHRSSADAALTWREVCQAVVGDYTSAHQL
jgi:glycosyltransferase involved in cell wall biosynthesis